MCKHHRPRYACGHEGDITSVEACDWAAHAQNLRRSGSAVGDPVIQHRILTWQRICEGQSTTVYEEQSGDCARCGRKKARKEAKGEAEGGGETGLKKLRVV
jgi:hypothetical protein